MITRRSLAFEASLTRTATAFYVLHALNFLEFLQSSLQNRVDDLIELLKA